MKTLDRDRAVVVGPLILDSYIMGTAKKLDQTAAVPVIAAEPGRAPVCLGGAANAAACLSWLTMPVAFVSAVGTDAASQKFYDTDYPMITKYVVKDSRYLPPVKHRLYADGKLVARFDQEQRHQPNLEDQIVDMFERCVADVKPLVILVSDYDKGVCTERTLEVIRRYAIENDVKIIVDPVPQHMPFYKGVNMLTPNEKEACAAAGVDDPGQAGHLLCRRHRIDRCLVTRGREPMLLTSQQDAGIAIDTAPAVAVDTCGAGDVIAAAVAYGYGAGMKLEQTMQIAVTAGALAVETLGANPVALAEVHRRLVQRFGPTNKLVDAPFAKLLRLSVGITKGKFGVTNGVFDVLHAGHVSMLRQAAAQCDFLLVLLNSDQSATRIKRKPLQSYDLRAATLAALPEVDAVLPFQADTPLERIVQLLPDVLFKGYELAGKEESIPGADVVIGNGGRVITTKMEYDTHATDIIQKAQMQAPSGEETASPPEAADSAG